jgi:hypothetical protein
MLRTRRRASDDIVNFNKWFPIPKSISTPTSKFVIHGNRFDDDSKAFREIECIIDIIFDANADINLIHRDFVDRLRQYFDTGFRETQLELGVQIGGIVDGSYTVAYSFVTLDIHAVGRALGIPFIHDRKRWSDVQFAVVKDITVPILIGSPTQNKHGVFAYDSLAKILRRKWHKLRGKTVKFQDRIVDGRSYSVRIINSASIIPQPVQVSADESLEAWKEKVRRRKLYKEIHTKRNEKGEEAQKNSETPPEKPTTQTEGQKDGTG